ncbi:hypothetical protein ACJJTC_013929 [Scirpophaga incertulas]
MSQRRSLRSRLDLLRSVSARELCVSRAQHSQQQHAGGVLRDLAPGEPVWARSFRQPDKWLKGTVANNQGTNRYVVNSGDGRLIPRHIDQIRRRSRMSNVPCPSGTNSDQFEGQVSIGSEDALADSNIPDVGSNDDVAEAISVTKRNSEISVPKPVEDPSEPTCTPRTAVTVRERLLRDGSRAKLDRDSGSGVDIPGSLNQVLTRSDTHADKTTISCLHFFTDVLFHKCQ